MFQVRLRRVVRRPTTPKGWLRAVLLLAAVPVLVEGTRVFAGSNRHAVIPGMVYRCRQPSGGAVREQVRDLGIRTVVNLRGFGPGPQSPWYAEECNATADLGVSQEDITLSARALPPPAELRRLIEVLDNTEYPILIHCKQGADRTGLVSAMVLLLYTDATPGVARRQLLPRYGHVGIGPTAPMDEFFDRYAAYRGDRPHTPALFRDWMLNHYSPGPASGTLTTAGENYTVRAGAWLSVPLTASNTSTEPWHLKPHAMAGVHVAFTLSPEAGLPVAQGQAGLFRATVPPGGKIELILAVPPLEKPGVYSLRADLIDATGAGVPVRANPFYKFGADPLLLRITVK